MSKLHKSSNPIGNQKPHVYLADMIKRRYNVLLEINHTQMIHPDDARITRGYTNVEAYRTLTDARAGTNMVARAISYCSPLDTFSKKEGLRIALKRLNLVLKETEMARS